MKNVFEFIFNPFKMLAVCGICFIIAFIDAVIVDAMSFSDLTTIGKIFIGLFTVAFTITFIRFFIVPILYWLYKLVKSLF